MLYCAMEAIFMRKTALEQILEPIAKARQVSPALLMAQMQQVMDEALRDPDPAVQAMWDSIPKAGERPTLEEFMDYLIDKKLLSP